MSKLYGFTKPDVNRISTAVRRVETSGSNLTSGSRHRTYADAVRNADLYAGYFKVTNTTLNDIPYVSVTAGEALINDSWFTMSAEADIDVVAPTGDTGTNWLYLEATFTPTEFDEYGQITQNAFVNTPTIEIDNEKPTYSDLYLRIILAEIGVSRNGIDVTITSVIQEQYGMLVGYIFDKLAEDIARSDELGEAIQNLIADQFCAASDSVCDENSKGCVRSGRMITLTGASASAVNTQVAEYGSTGQRTGKCKDAGPLFNESCGSSVMTVSDTNTLDGTEYFAKLYLCCCEQGEDDEVEPCISCSEKTSECENGPCITSTTTYTSSSYADYLSCIRIQTAATTQGGLDSYCTSLQVEEAYPYYKGCCFTALSPCSLSEERWSFSYIPCCCEALPCPPYVEISQTTRDILGNPGTTSLTFTNSTKCSDLQCNFTHPTGDSYLYGGTMSISGVSKGSNFSDSASDSDCANIVALADLSYPVVGGYILLDQGESVTLTMTSACDTVANESIYCRGKYDSRLTAV